MGKIVISENVTLDGVIRTRPVRKASGAAAGSVVSASGVAKGHQGPARRGAGRRGPAVRSADLRVPRRAVAIPEWQLADRLNDMPKYVVSSTLKDPDWNNSTVLAGDVIQEVSKLKEELDGEIVVAGSIRLVRTLMENGLVNELRLMIYPVLLGAGERLFGETSDRRPVRLVETRPSTTSPTSPTRPYETAGGEVLRERCQARSAAT